MTTTSGAGSKACEQLVLPFGVPVSGFDEGTELRAKNGNKLQRWGSAPQAMKILGILHKATLYELIKSGDIPAYKLRKTRNGNSPYKVDLLACWEYRQKRIVEVIN